MCAALGQWVASQGFDASDANFNLLLANLGSALANAGGGSSDYTRMSAWGGTLQGNSPYFYAPTPAIGALADGMCLVFRCPVTVAGNIGATLNWANTGARPIKAPNVTDGSPKLWAGGVYTVRYSSAAGCYVIQGIDDVAATYNSFIARLNLYDINATLNAGAWLTSGNYKIYNIVNSRISATCEVEIYPDPAMTAVQFNAYNAAKIIGYSQSNGTATIQARGAPPTVHIPIKLCVWNTTN